MYKNKQYLPMYMIVNVMGYQNTMFFMMANILTTSRDLGQMNSL